MMDDWQRSGWPVVRIRDIGRLHGGGTPSRKRPEYFQGDIPWITGQDIPDNRVATIEQARDYVTKEAVSESATRIVPAGTVLITTRVSVGKTAVAGCPICFSQDVTALLIHSEAIALPAYVAHYLRSRQPALLQKNQGSTIAGITRDSLALEQIPLPPLSEQQRIVDILQEAEAIRRLRAEAEAKTAELIPALFYQGLGKQLSERKKPLGDWFETNPNYGTMTPADENPGSDGLFCLRVGNIQNNRIDLSDRKYVQRSSINLERHTVRTGDIILARAIASEEHLGKAVVITQEEDGFAFDSHLMRIRVRKDELLPEFLQVYLYSAPGRNAFLKQARQSAVQFNVNAQEMARVLVPDVPPPKQLEVIQGIKETESLCRHLESTTSLGSQLTASLAAHAFTGQLTEGWRASRPNLLAKEARKRDDELAEATGKPILINFSASNPEDEAEVWKQVPGISREQWLLLFQIRAMNLRKELPRYFTAELIADQIKGPLHRHPQAIESHLTVFAVRGVVIPVSRARVAVAGKPFAASYRLPMNEEGAAPEQRDDVKAERMKHQRTRAAGKR